MNQSEQVFYPNRGVNEMKDCFSSIVSRVEELERKSSELDTIRATLFVNFSADGNASKCTGVVIDPELNKSSSATQILITVLELLVNRIEVHKENEAYWKTVAKLATFVELAMRWETEAVTPEVLDGSDGAIERNAVERGERQAKRECADHLRMLVATISTAGVEKGALKNGN